jgi:hypothetical protein
MGEFLVEAAKNGEWEKVEVRRPLEVVFSSECGPSRSVRLELGQWDLRRRTPDSALL